ncbi:MAG TPA: hypothetical protein PLX97_09405, partial [Gemmatales bacterium]|nr:hypothetical protein [Gemmatales bacterium]
MPQVKGLTDVIGQPAWQQGICFVPVIGEFCFTPPRYYLHEFADVSFLQKFMSLENEDAYLNDSLWVRARLIKVFGIHHLSGHAMRTLINFQGIALEWDHEMARPVWLTPFLISDTWNGYIDEFVPSTDSSIAFP